MLKLYFKVGVCRISTILDTIVQPRIVRTAGGSDDANLQPWDDKIRKGDVSRLRGILWNFLEDFWLGGVGTS